MFGTNRKEFNGQQRSLVERLESRQMLSAVPLGSKIKVSMITDSQGNPVNSSRITVRFSENIDLVDTAQFRLFGYAVNPASGSGTAQQKVTINITSVTQSTDNTLVLETDRRVRKNAKLTIYDGAITNADASATGELSTNLPKGLNKERFTLACRAWKPTNLVYFSKTQYEDAANLTATPSQPSTNTVTTNLTAFLDKKVAAGIITADEKTAALAKFNDTTIKSLIPSANLRAALVSLVGTVAEGAIDAYTTTGNVTGKKFTIIDYSSEVSGSAVVSETKGNPTTGRLRTLYKTSFQGESFIALSANLAHEAVHQDIVGSTEDLPDGQNEEIFANTIDTIVWAEQLLVDSAPANDHTQLTTALNANLLAMLNSGTALFPRVGVYDAPHIGSQNIFPGGDSVAGGDYTSFEDYIRRTYAARGFADTDTTGNAYSRTVQNNITARTDTAAFNFSDSRITFYDNSQQIISDKNAVKLAAILDLQVAK